MSVCHPDAIDAVHGVRSRCTKGAAYDVSLPMTTLQQMRDRVMHDRRRQSGWDDAFSAQCTSKIDG